MSSKKCVDTNDSCSKVFKFVNTDNDEMQM